MIKAVLRDILNYLHIDITQNQRYDRMTHKIFRKVLKSNSNCVDIGCHKGEMLDVMLSCAPQGKFWAFEPIPGMYQDLKARYNSPSINIYPYALSDAKGLTTFNFVKNAPAYSGLNKRAYAVKNPQIEQIPVNLERLDDVLPADIKIDLIKIDVEGAEYQVLKGALRTINTHRPVVVFECGLGGIDYYGTTPEEIFEFFADQCKMNIYLLKSFLTEGTPLSKAEFLKIYQENSDYYFIAK